MPLLEKLTLNDPGEAFEIRGNPFNPKIGMRLYKFLRMITAPRIAHTAIYS